jgi:hypothetical protein
LRRWWRRFFVTSTFIRKSAATGCSGANADARANTGADSGTHTDSDADTVSGSDANADSGPDDSSSNTVAGHSGANAKSWYSGTDSVARHTFAESDSDSDANSGCAAVIEHPAPAERSLRCLSLAKWGYTHWRSRSDC